VIDDALLEELEAIERPATARPRWPWLLVVVGAAAIVALGFHAYTAYATVDRINQSSRIEAVNPLVLFQDVATNGPRVGANVESSSRGAYARALEQFALDGTGVCLGIVLVVAGCFVLLNQ
jgi:hypothetical protein